VYSLRLGSFEKTRKEVGYKKGKKGSLGSWGVRRGGQLRKEINRVEREEGWRGGSHVWGCLRMKGGVFLLGGKQ